MKRPSQRLGRGVMPKGKRQRQTPQKHIEWPVLDWTETAEYRRNLEETRRVNLSEGLYEALLIAQAVRALLK